MIKNKKTSINTDQETQRKIYSLIEAIQGLKCPITLDFIKEPCEGMNATTPNGQAKDGNMPIFMERPAAQEWLTRSQTNPTTREPMTAVNNVQDQYFQNISKAIVALTKQKLKLHNQDVSIIIEFIDFVKEKKREDLKTYSETQKKLVKIQNNKLPASKRLPPFIAAISKHRKECRATLFRRLKTLKKNAVDQLNSLTALGKEIQSQT